MSDTIIHELWGKENDRSALTLFGRFDAARWQWALKLRASLRDKGYIELRIKNVAIKKNK